LALPGFIRAQDYNQALGELRPYPWQNWGSHDPYEVGDWRGTGSPAAPQPDDAHFNQTLFNLGFNPQDIPQWYRDKYLREYNP
jgi:hypothetical protein